MRTVAALYVDPRGPYPSLAACGCFDRKAPGHRCSFSDRLECWDEVRDARKYDGPHPIVAHPPCGPWGALKHLYRGNEHDCGPRAFEQVRAYGGVLEHPAGSKLFAHMGAVTPADATDSFGGRTYELCQCNWEHCARKRTWIYVVRVDQRKVMRALAAARKRDIQPTHWVSGFRSTIGRNLYAKNGSAVPPGIKVCSAQQRRRTPPLFAAWLVSLARAAE